jgi:[ribosomal protein S5]-alanine N-acetyltransferase
LPVHAPQSDLPVARLESFLFVSRRSGATAVSTPAIEHFETARLTAERLRSEHRLDYIRLLQDRRVMRTLSPDGQPLSVEQAAAWLQLSLQHWDRHGFGYWLIRARADNQFVGRAGLKQDLVDGREEIELAYALLPAYWGQGLATELGAAILKVGFEKLGLADVICFTLTTNLASQRVMQKLGFEYEREGTHVGLPHVFYRLTAAQFSARWASG